MFNDKDTIIAPATAVTGSGLVVLRVSGARSFAFLKSVFFPTDKSCNYQSHCLYHGKILDDNNQVVDEVMAVFMQPPRTYTTEEVVEIHCHGSRQIVRRIIDLASTHSIRLAKPGEFTYRAYLNGRIDLIQAESVSRLIQSSSELSRKAALQHLDGLLSRKLYDLSSIIKSLLVQIEAWIDFPEEDLPAEDLTHITAVAIDIYDQMSELLSTYRSGQHIHEGAVVALAGLPNAGKSSLMNALLKQDRSIVSDLPGTTRDSIEQSTQLSGINVRLVDTAGLRNSDDFIEQEGVRRALDIVNKADLILLLVDGTEPVSDQFLELLSEFSSLRVVLVVNKIDLSLSQNDFGFFHGTKVMVSAKSGSGIEELLQTVSLLLLDNYIPTSESPCITERRHYEALLSAASHMSRFVDNAQSSDLDLLSIDLRSALDSLGAITGVVTTEAILDEIFSSFCIGK